MTNIKTAPNDLKCYRASIEQLKMKIQNVLH